MTLTDFLLARIAEDEARVSVMADRWPYDGGWSDEDCARILAECEAKRRVVRLAAMVVQHDTPEGAQDSGFTVGAKLVGMGVMAALAQPYAAHPDYQDEWRV